MKQVKEYLSYAAGAFGHDAFYATLSTYFMMFVTSQLFNTSDAGFNDRMIGWVTGLIVALRIVEIIFDPVLVVLLITRVHVGESLSHGWLLLD